MADPVATPAPAAVSPPAAATPAPVPAAVPVNAAAAPTPQPAAEPTPAAADPPVPQPAKDTAPAVVEALIGDGTKPADATAEAGKPVSEPVKPAEPTAYDLKLPDGVEVDAPLMDSAKAIFAEGKIAPEIAQKLVTLQAGQMQALAKAAADNQINVWNTTIRAWQKEAIEDPVLGGQKWTATKSAIETGLQTVFGVTPTTPANAPERAAHKAFVAALAYTGAGSNPAIIRGLHRMVAPRSEGRPAPVGGPSAPKKSPAQVMYENSKQAAE